SAVIPGTAANTKISLYDSTTSLLVENDDISFSTTTLMGTGPYSSDSLILNYIAPTTGDYFIQVENMGGTVGDYQLLVAGVPEPGTMALALFGISVIATRRRKKQSKK